MQKVSIAFADDHPVLLRGMSGLFAEHDNYVIAGQVSSADAAIALVLSKHPDILITDLSMPGDVFGAIGKIALQAPLTRVIVFTAFSSVESALKALSAGAVGFVLKGSLCEELFEAVTTVRTGEVYITRQYAAQVMAGLRDENRRRSLNAAIRLSVREKQIVGQLLQARTNKEIAEVLKISEKTVKHYMTSLMSKLHARNRVEVAVAAQKNNELERSSASN